MSHVVDLDEYRGRRESRLRQTLALHRADPEREEVVLRLREVLELVGADRAAVLWVDEYGPGLAHADCVVDLASDRPRRAFALGPLLRSWEDGIPGLVDIPSLRHTREILPDGPRSLLSISLGSDGGRAWFLAADSRAPRPPLSKDVAESVSFLAGQCAALILGTGKQSIADRPEDDVLEFERLRKERFAGWPVLQDAEDERDDPIRDRTITVRFLVARMLFELAEDDFVVDRGPLSHQIRSIRQELETQSAALPVARACTRVLDAVEVDDREELIAAVLELGVESENLGHVHGARELHRIAYDIATAAKELEGAVDAARFLGRVSRRLGVWEESVKWYEVARGIAGSGGLRRREALALDGLGNTYRVRGNLPRAREIYCRVLELGQELCDDDVRGSAQHSLMLVEKHAGHTDEALRHGWAAIETFRNEERVMVALADLGDVFFRCGEIDCAESAFQVVRSRASHLDLRAVASDALAHASALRGDGKEFKRRVASLSDDELSRVGVDVRADIYLYRAKSHLALDEWDEARVWLQRSLEHAERHGVSRIVIEAEAAIVRLDERKRESGKELPEPTPETISALREPLATLQTEAAWEAVTI